MVPQIWSSDEFQWEGRFWNVPPRRVLPKPMQKPHPPIWVACMQPATYEIAAERGIGVLAFSSNAPSTLAEHIGEYKKNVKQAIPVGQAVNDQWANFTVGYCGEENAEAQELGAKAIKAFLAPGRPYTQDRAETYARLVEAWGGVPDDLRVNFNTILGTDDSEGSDADVSGGGVNYDVSVWEAMDAATLCERGVVVAGDPESCIEGVKWHEESGADQLMLMMQSDQIPHEKAMSSIALFGREVIPAFRDEQST